MKSIQKFEKRDIVSVEKHHFHVCVIVILLIGCIFMFFIAKAADVAAIKLETEQMKDRLVELIEKKERLELEYEKRNDLRYIEVIAKNQFGMIKKDEVRKFYIQLEKEDRVEVYP